MPHRLRRPWRVWLIESLLSCCSTRCQRSPECAPGPPAPRSRCPDRAPHERAWLTRPWARTGPARWFPTSHACQPAASARPHPPPPRGRGCPAPPSTHATSPSSPRSLSEGPRERYVTDPADRPFKNHIVHHSLRALRDEPEGEGESIAPPGDHVDPTAPSPASVRDAMMRQRVDDGCRRNTGPAREGFPFHPSLIRANTKAVARAAIHFDKIHIRPARLKQAMRAELPS